MSRIATGTGDGGETGLADGSRVAKDDPRIEAYGDVDELNALLGLIASDAKPGPMRETLVRVQRELFDLGADLADPAGKHGVRIGPSHVSRLDSELDRVEASLPPLKKFILPGGTMLAARLHLARTVCRRAERRMVTLARAEGVNPEALTYVNRLSDLLFLYARQANDDAGVKDPEVEFT